MYHLIVLFYPIAHCGTLKGIHIILETYSCGVVSAVGDK